MVDRKRMELRLDQDFYDQVKHFSDKQDVTINEFMVRALDHYMKFIQSDYDLPSAEIKRLNQLVDNQHANNIQLQALTNAINNGFKGIANLMNGDNYLDDGR